MDIILNDGYKVSVADDALDDYEVYEAIVDLDTENETEEAKKKSAAALPVIVNGLLGEEGKRGLVTHLKETKGRAKLTEMVAAVSEIITKLGDKSKK